MESYINYIKYLYDKYHKIFIAGVPINFDMYKVLIREIIVKPIKSDDIFVINYIHDKSLIEDIIYFFNDYIDIVSKTRIIFNNGTKLRFRNYQNNDVDNYNTSLVILSWNWFGNVSFDIDIDKHKNIVILNFVQNIEKTDLYYEYINYNEYLSNPNLLRNKMLKDKINKIKNNCNDTKN